MFCEQKYEDEYIINPSQVNKEKLNFVKKMKHKMFLFYAIFIVYIIVDKFIL